MTRSTAPRGDAQDTVPAVAARAGKALHPLPAIRQDVGPLIEAWRKARLEVLLVGDGHLSEFIYPTPGSRAVSSIEVVIDPRRATEAIEIALDLGWRARDFPGTGNPSWSDEIDSLIPPLGSVHVDLKQFVLPGHSEWSPVQRRITWALLTASHLEGWAGTRVRIPDPVDAILLLALRRGWTAGWTLQAEDMRDMSHLVRHVGPEWRAALVARARELGCLRTVLLFLKQGDPEAEHLLDAEPAWHGRMLRDLAVLGERPLGRLEALMRGPTLLLEVARAFPWLLRARRAAWAGGSIRGMVDALAPANPPALPGTMEERTRAAHGVRLAARLLFLGEASRKLVLPLAALGRLGELGWPVELVTGNHAARAGDGRAWLELRGSIVPGLQDPDALAGYRPMARYPASATANGRAALSPSANGKEKMLTRESSA